MDVVLMIEGVIIEVIRCVNIDAYRDSDGTYQSYPGKDRR